VAYQDEEAIKAQLRELTRKTQKLRHELDAMVRGSEAKDLTRGTVTISGKLRLDPPAVSDDRRRPPTKR
jgi:hypothetical protein